MFRNLASKELSEKHTWKQGIQLTTYLNKYPKYRVLNIKNEFTS